MVTAAIIAACSPTPDPALTREVVDYAGVLPEGASGRLGKGAPTILAFTDDGQSLAVGSNVGLYMFDTQTLEEQWAIPSDQPVTAAAFTESGGLIAAGLEDGTLFLVDAESGNITNKKDGGGDASVQALAWQGAETGEGQLLATGFNDGNIILSLIQIADSSTTLEPAEVLGRAFTGVSALAFSPNRRILVTGNRSGGIQFWDTEDKILLGELLGHENRQPIRMLRWSGDGEVLYSSNENGQVIVWDIRQLIPSHIIEGHTGAVFAIDPDADDENVFSVGADGRLNTWATTDGTRQVSLDSSVGPLITAALSKDGAKFAAVSEAGSLHVWDINANSIAPAASLEGFSADNSWARASSWHPDGAWLATNMWDQVIVWAPAARERLQTLDGHEGMVTRLAYSPAGDRLASASRDQLIIIWDAASGKRLQTLSGHTSVVTDVAWSPDGTRLASAGSLDNQVIVWDVGSGEIIETMLGPNEAVWSVAWSPDGKTIALGTMAGEVVFWDTDNLSEYVVEKYLAHLAWVSDLVWSPDGALLGTAGADGLARIWDFESRRVLQNLIGHSGVVTSLDFSPDGAMLGTSAGDEIVIVWEVGEDENAPDPRHIFSGHLDGIDSVKWSPDGSQLASASRDGTVILWEPSGVEK